MTKGGIHWLGVYGNTGFLDTRLKKVLKVYSAYNFDRILDVGCGDGCFAKLLGEVSYGFGSPSGAFCGLYSQS